MNNSTKILYGVAIVAVLYYVWMMKKKGVQLTNMQLAERIKAAGKYMGDVNNLASFGNDYLTAWYGGVVSGQTFFMYKGGKYNVQGGKVMA